MLIRHGCGRLHEVSLIDEGTMDTVVDVDGRTFRYSEADRRDDGTVRSAWLREVAIEACNAGDLTEAEEDAS